MSPPTLHAGHYNCRWFSTQVNGCYNRDAYHRTRNIGIAVLPGSKAMLGVGHHEFCLSLGLTRVPRNTQARRIRHIVYVSAEQNLTHHAWAQERQRVNHLQRQAAGQSANVREIKLPVTLLGARIRRSLTTKICQLAAAV